MEIPCKNCITLPICKSIQYNRTDASCYIEWKLIKKCSILYNFLDRPWKYVQIGEFLDGKNSM